MELPMTNLVSRFVKDESGATAIEYALIAGGISIVIVAAVNLVGTSLNGTFNGVANLLAPYDSCRPASKASAIPGPLLFRRTVIAQYA
jgi:pilus assembly protein Flp/PilA